MNSFKFLGLAFAPEMIAVGIVAVVVFVIFGIITLALLGTGKWVPGFIFLFLLVVDGLFIKYFVMETVPLPSSAPAPGAAGAVAQAAQAAGGILSWL